MTTVTFKKAGIRHEVRFKYDPDLVSLIKTTVPGFMRSWDGDTKTWTVESVWAKALIDLMKAAGHTVIGAVEEPKKMPPMPPQEGWAEELMRRVSPDLRTSVHRALSKVLHSDLGGDGALQQELNDARGRYDTSRGATA